MADTYHAFVQESLPETQAWLAQHPGWSRLWGNGVWSLMELRENRSFVEKASASPNAHLLPPLWTNAKRLRAEIVKIVGPAKADAQTVGDVLADLTGHPHIGH